jgi:hypothetical protein
MAKFSMKRDGKEVGPASVYAEPHDMSGKAVGISTNPGKPSDLGSLNTMRMSVGMYNNGPDKTTKTAGIQTRGNGCATKGTMARGPMA